MRITHSRFIPTGSTERRDAESDAVVYTYEHAGAPLVIAYHGKALRSDFHFRCKSVEGRELTIERFFAARRQRLAGRQQAAKARTEFQHTVQVGDVFYTSWGYDQTNVEYFEVVARRGKKQVLVREIAKHYQETGSMQGRSAPAKGEFLADSCALGKGNPAKVCVVRSGHEGRPSLRIDEVRSAWPATFAQVGGLKVYEAHGESSYA